jgi:glycosyltransferase involved in cell wall biosynthesis
MKIAVFHDLPYGGARRTLYSHLSALKDAGNEIEIWILTDWPDERDFSRFGKIHDLNIDRKIISKLQGEFKNPRHFFQTSKLIKQIGSYQQQCANEINSGNFDFAFINSCSITYMPYIGKFLTIPSILYLGEPYRWLYEAVPDNPWMAPCFSKLKLKNILKDFFVIYSKRLQVRQEIDCAKRYNKILVNSYYTKESLLRYYGLESEVCYWGIDTSLFKYNIFKYNIIEKKDYVVGLGLLYPPKGVDRAIKLIGQIDKTIRPELKWISNGCDTNYLKQMQDLARELNVQFSFYENIPDSELIEKLAQALFMIYTSRLEPFGLAPLEANSCGTFTIGIAEAGIRESIKHGINGYLVNGIYDANFKKYAEEIIKDKNYAIQLGKQSREYVCKNWSIPNLKNNLIDKLQIP